MDCLLQYCAPCSSYVDCHLLRSNLRCTGTQFIFQLRLELRKPNFSCGNVFVFFVSLLHHPMLSHLGAWHSLAT